MRITRGAYQKLIYDCPPVPPESGGMLGGHGGFVDTIHFDFTRTMTDRLIYIPNVNSLNVQLERWCSCGIEFMGLFHSHPQNQPSLSSADECYIRQIMKEMPLSIEVLYFPIIYPRYGMDAFCASRKRDGIVIKKEGICISL